MLSMSDLIHRIYFGGPRNRQVMARIVLNQLGFPRQFHVDLSELKGLSFENRSLIRQFLDKNHAVPLPHIEPNSSCYRNMVDIARTPGDVANRRESFRESGDKGNVRVAKFSAAARMPAAPGRELPVEEAPGPEAC